jgi:alkylresorcinol/alkylpyrone synthase
MVADLGGLGQAKRSLLARLHANSGVEFRHLAFPIEEYRDLYGIGQSNERYAGAATGLAVQALRGALGEAGVLARDLDLLIVTSVTGVTVPSVDALLITRLGLRPDIKRLPVFGLGCVAGAAALARLHDYLLAWPAHTAALVSVEVCSLRWPRAEITTADLVVSGLFADGAVAVIVQGEQAAEEHGRSARPGGPRIIATHSEICPDGTDALGWRLGPNGFRIVLTADLSDVVERTLATVVTYSRAGLRPGKWHAATRARMFSPFRFQARDRTLFQHDCRASWRVRGQGRTQRPCHRGNERRGAAPGHSGPGRPPRLA